MADLGGHTTKGFDNNLASQYKLLEADILALSSENTRLHDENDSYKERLHELEVALADKDDELLHVEDEFEQEKYQVKELEMKIAMMDAALQERAIQVQAQSKFEEEYDRQVSQVVSMRDAEIRELSSRNANLVSQVHALQTEVGKLHKLKGFQLPPEVVSMILAETDAHPGQPGVDTLLKVLTEKDRQIQQLKNALEDAQQIIELNTLAGGAGIEDGGATGVGGANSDAMARVQQEVQELKIDRAALREKVEDQDRELAVWKDKYERVTSGDSELSDWIRRCDEAETNMVDAQEQLRIKTREEQETLEEGIELLHENRLLRQMANVDASAVLDYRELKIAATVAAEAVKARCQRLEEEVQELEEERAVLKNRMLSFVELKANKGVIFHGLNPDQVDLVEKYAENLRRGWDNYPEADHSLELRRELRKLHQQLDTHREESDRATRRHIDAKVSELLKQTNELAACKRELETLKDANEKLQNTLEQVLSTAKQSSSSVGDAGPMSDRLAEIHGLILNMRLPAAPSQPLMQQTQQFLPLAGSEVDPETQRHLQQGLHVKGIWESLAASSHMQDGRIYASMLSAAEQGAPVALPLPPVVLPAQAQDGAQLAYSFLLRRAIPVPKYLLQTAVESLPSLYVMLVESFEETRRLNIANETLSTDLLDAETLLERSAAQVRRLFEDRFSEQQKWQTEKYDLDERISQGKSDRQSLQEKIRSLQERLETHESRLSPDALQRRLGEGLERAALAEARQIEVQRKYDAVSDEADALRRALAFSEVDMLQTIAHLQRRAGRLAAFRTRACILLRALKGRMQGSLPPTQAVKLRKELKQAYIRLAKLARQRKVEQKTRPALEALASQARAAQESAIASEDALFDCGIELNVLRRRLARCDHAFVAEWRSMNRLVTALLPGELASCEAVAAKLMSLGGDDTIPAHLVHQALLTAPGSEARAFTSQDWLRVLVICGSTVTSVDQLQRDTCKIEPIVLVSKLRLFGLPTLAVESLWRRIMNHATKSNTHPLDSDLQADPSQALDLAFQLSQDASEPVKENTRRVLTSDALAKQIVLFLKLGRLNATESQSLRMWFERLLAEERHRQANALTPENAPIEQLPGVPIEAISQALSEALSNASRPSALADQPEAENDDPHPGSSFAFGDVTGPSVRLSSAPVPAAGPATSSYLSSLENEVYVAILRIEQEGISRGFTVSSQLENQRLVTHHTLEACIYIMAPQISSVLVKQIYDTLCMKGGEDPSRGVVPSTFLVLWKSFIEEHEAVRKIQRAFRTKNAPLKSVSSSVNSKQRDLYSVGNDRDFGELSSVEARVNIPRGVKDGYAAIRSGESSKTRIIEARLHRMLKSAKQEERRNRSRRDEGETRLRELESQLDEIAQDLQREQMRGAELEAELRGSVAITEIEFERQEWDAAKARAERLDKDVHHYRTLCGVATRQAERLGEVLKSRGEEDASLRQLVEELHGLTSEASQVGALQRRLLVVQWDLANSRRFAEGVNQTLTATREELSSLEQGGCGKWIALAQALLNGENPNNDGMSQKPTVQAISSPGDPSLVESLRSQLVIKNAEVQKLLKQVKALQAASKDDRQASEQHLKSALEGVRKMLQEGPSAGAQNGTLVLTNADPTSAEREQELATAANLAKLEAKTFEDLLGLQQKRADKLADELQTLRGAMDLKQADPRNWQRQLAEKEEQIALLEARIANEKAEFGRETQAIRIELDGDVSRLERVIRVVRGDEAKTLLPPTRGPKEAIKVACRLLEEDHQEVSLLQDALRRCREEVVARQTDLRSAADLYERMEAALQTERGKVSELEKSLKDYDLEAQRRKQQSVLAQRLQKRELELKTSKENLRKLVMKLEELEVAATNANKPASAVDEEEISKLQSDAKRFRSEAIRLKKELADAQANLSSAADHSTALTGKLAAQSAKAEGDLQRARQEVQDLRRALLAEQKREKLAASAQSISTASLLAPKKTSPPKAPAQPAAPTVTAPVIVPVATTVPGSMSVFTSVPSAAQVTHNTGQSIQDELNSLLLPTPAAPAPAPAPITLAASSLVDDLNLLFMPTVAHPAVPVQPAGGFVSAPAVQPLSDDIDDELRMLLEPTGAPRKNVTVGTESLFPPLNPTASAFPPSPAVNSLAASQVNTPANNLRSQSKTMFGMDNADSPGSSRRRSVPAGYLGTSIERAHESVRQQTALDRMQKVSDAERLEGTAGRDKALAELENAFSQKARRLEAALEERGAECKRLERRCEEACRQETKLKREMEVLRISLASAAPMGGTGTVAGMPPSTLAFGQTSQHEAPLKDAAISRLSEYVSGATAESELALCRAEANVLRRRLEVEARSVVEKERLEKAQLRQELKRQHKRAQQLDALLASLRQQQQTSSGQHPAVDRLRDMLTDATQRAEEAARREREAQEARQQAEQAVMELRFDAQAAQRKAETQTRTLAKVLGPWVDGNGVLENALVTAWPEGAEQIRRHLKLIKALALESERDMLAADVTKPGQDLMNRPATGNFADGRFR